MKGRVKQKLYGFCRDGKLVREDDGSYTFFDNLDAAMAAKKPNERIAHASLSVAKSLPR